MFAAPIPIAIALFAIFNPPSGLGQTGLLIWFAGSVIALRQAMAFFHTPHLALGGELSPDYMERSKVMAYNSFFTWAGGALTTWLALSYFFPATTEYPRGLLNPEPWPRYAFAISAATLTILFLSAWFTKDRIPYLPKPAPDAPRFSAKEFVKDLARALSNINYVWLLVGYLFLSMMVGLREGLRLYVGTFYWGLSSEELRWYILGSFIGFLLAFAAAARLHGRFDKKRTIIIAVLVYSIAPAVPIVLGMAGVLRHDTPGLLQILVAFSVLGYGAFSVLQISVMSALADVADENELRHGVRQEGVLYATRALAAKVDQAIGSAIAGFVLTLIAFPVKAKPGEVPEGVLFNLALWDGVLAAIPGVLAVIFYARYRITRQSYEATKAELQKRRPATPAAAPAMSAEGLAPPVADGVTAPAAPRP
jgi:Na+/melibiose symporter-like transporter